MKKTPFGRTGFEVSGLGFGGAPIGFLGTTPEAAGKLLNQMLDRGVNFIDTAANYAGSEELIGNAIGHRRGEFVLVSKCGQKFPDLQGEAWSATVIRQTIERSLQRLKTDHLDVMLLHTCSLQTLQTGEALGALVEARNAGKIRVAGYSGDNEAAAWAADQPDIAAIETSISIADQANIDLVLPAARQNGVGVIAKRPIANAAWKPLDEQPGIYRDYAGDYTQRLQKMGLTPQELGFKGDPAKAWPEIALRFTLTQPGVQVAIVGTTNPQRLADNIAYVERGPLPEATAAKIRAAFQQAAAGQEWVGLG